MLIDYKKKNSNFTVERVIRHPLSQVMYINITNNGENLIVCHVMDAMREMHHYILLL